MALQTNLQVNQRVQDIVQTDVLVCDPELHLVEAARLMRARNCSSIIVVDGEGKPVGIWTEHDAIRIDFSSAESFETPIGVVMSSPLKSISPHASIDEAAMRFREERIRHFVVETDDGAFLGVISQTDVALGHSVDHYLTLRAVTSAMHHGALHLSADLPLGEAVREMQRVNCDAAIVEFSDGRHGIITERDLVRLIAEAHPGGTLADVASVPLLTVSDSGSLLAARNLLERKGVRHLGVVDENGLLCGLLAIADILNVLQHDYLHNMADTLRERDEQLLRSRRDLQLAKRVIDSAHNAIVIASADGKVEFVNPAFLLLCGHPEQALLGTPFIEVVAGTSAARDLLQRELEGKATSFFWEGEVDGLRADGSHFPQWVSIELSDDSAGTGKPQYIINIDDITERKSMEEKIRHLAYYDSLTGLPNRTLFIDRLATRIVSGQRHGRYGALLFMDLDNFKSLNDVRGHESGDRLLQQVSSRLLSLLRDEDTVARLGGDEFVVLLPELGESQEGAAQHALSVAEKLREAVAVPFQLGDFEHQVGVSIGLTTFPKGRETVDDLLKEADTAMYRAKASGRNAVRYFEPAMQSEAESRFAMEKDLRGALTNSQFSLYLQPQYDRGGRVVGAEALLRWQHPERGMVPPDAFITLAEESGLIVAIGEWVLAESCRLLALLGGMGLQQTIAVNISPRQFHQNDFVERVVAILEESGADPARLILEITENVVLGDVNDTVAKMEQLRLHGIRFSVDDFGTGYSSLAYLKKLPLHELKIDRAFVRDLALDSSDKALVETILSVARHLSLSVVAEGVETDEQNNFLRDKGCPGYQGYLYARPMPAQDFIDAAGS